MFTQFKDQQWLLTKSDDTGMDYLKNKNIVAVFEEQAKKTPGNIAVIFEEVQITYRELNERANQVAYYLQRRGIKKEVLVPVCIEQRVEMMVGLLGILKAGGAYVFIDPEYLSNKISYMLKDTKARIIVSSTKSTSKLFIKEDIDIVEIDTLNVSNESADNLSIAIDANHLAYVIYTFGAAGQPKRVRVEHGKVVSLVKGVDCISLTNQDTLPATGSPLCDATTFMYWSLLLNGESLILCTENKILTSRLPRTPDGKIDKKALPHPGNNQLSNRKYTAPRGKIEDQLLSIWQRLLGIERVGVHDNFFELGGYSLLAMKIVDQIKQLGYNVTLKDIFIHQTISRLVSVIEVRSSEKGTNGTSSLPAINGKGSCLIPIQPKGTNTPFFVIREYWLYKKLTHYLGENQPFYCLDGSTAATVQAIAARYITDMKVVQPDGPYLLGGFCGGGLVAFEMAHQLIAQGEKVSVLALIELYTHNGEVQKNYFNFYRRKLKGLSQKLYELPRKEKAGYFLKVIRTYCTRFLKKVGLVKDLAYVIKPYPGKVTLIKGKGSRMSFFFRDPNMGWSAYVKGGIDLVEVEGDHHSIFKEPGVVTLAENLSRIIDASKRSHIKRNEEL